MTQQHSEAPQAGPAGKVEIEGEQATLHFQRSLAHPPERVWAALTDPAQLAKWFQTKAVIDGRPGGSVDMVSGVAQFHWTGKILTWEPHRVYEYEWNAEPRPELPKGEKTVVRWELAPSATGTTLTMTHRRLTKGTALGFAPGTHAFLDALEAQLSGKPLPNWMVRYDEVKGLYPAWSRG